MMKSNGIFVKPNLFIVGAPKCGTTALSEYLKTHPDIYVLKEKETHYFCFDFNKRYPRPSSMQEYLNRFRKGRGKKIIVDASPWYLYSNVAIKKAYDFNPEAKFIAMVRNPCEMVPSLHQQLLNNYDEDQNDLLSAWELQERRQQGINIPARCREPKLLQYSEICKIGLQIQSFFEIVPPNKRMVIVFDDFKLDANTVYKKVLSFIDLEDDGRIDFPIINESFQWRFQKLSNFAFTPSNSPDLINTIGKKILNFLGLERVGLFRIFFYINNNFNRKNFLREKPSEKLMNYFRKDFSDDLELIGNLLQRDLTIWLK